MSGEKNFKSLNQVITKSKTKSCYYLVIVLIVLEKVLNSNASKLQCLIDAKCLQELTAEHKI